MRFLAGQYPLMQPGVNFVGAGIEIVKGRKAFELFGAAGLPVYGAGPAWRLNHIE
jgi:hypothetical protein